MFGRSVPPSIGTPARMRRRVASLYEAKCGGTEPVRVGELARRHAPTVGARTTAALRPAAMVAWDTWAASPSVTYRSRGLGLPHVLSIASNFASVGVSHVPNALN